MAKSKNFSITISFAQASKLKTGKQLAVYMVLRSFQGKNKTCWPSQDAILDRLKGYGITLSKSRLSHVVSELISAGLIERTQRGKRCSNVYSFPNDNAESDFRNSASHVGGDFRNSATGDFRNSASPLDFRNSASPNKKAVQIKQYNQKGDILQPEALFSHLRTQVSSGSLSLIKSAYISHNGKYVFSSSLPTHLQVCIQKIVPAKFQKQNTKKRAKKLAR